MQIWGQMNMKTDKFEANWDSLRSYTCPKWFRDAKFGIWAHWGVGGVPMYGDWYGRKMYEEGSDAYYHHWKNYGHPSVHGYKDLIGDWKAEEFDPDRLLELYKKAGAKYFMALAVHHDNFDNWDSSFHTWNSVQKGPHKDIIGMWKAAAEKAGLPFGVSEHLGASQLWWLSNKGMDQKGPYKGVPYDGCDEAYRELYHPVFEDKDYHFCYSTDENVAQDWYRRISELLEKYRPSMLYTDGPFPYGELGMKIVAQLYNQNMTDTGTQGVYTQKDVRKEWAAGILDVERGGLNDISDKPWQTDTCLGNWFYDVRADYKSARQVIDMLIHAVSKNGNLLLSVPLRPEGKLDDECIKILEQIGNWLERNGESIYGTRPWRRFGEGDTLRFSNPLFEVPLNWTHEDFHFTRKADKVYVFQMKLPPKGRCSVITSFADSIANPLGSIAVKRVTLLDTREEIAFRQTAGGLELTLPDSLQDDFPVVYMIETGEENQNV